MPKISRRSFLTGTASAAAGVAAGAAAQSLPGTADAATAGPALGGPRRPGTHGSLADIKHVIVFMQENRSFDHYFGSMRGTRGFGDRSIISLPNGNPVFEQPTTTAGESQFPWPVTGNPPTDGASGEVLGQCFQGTDHSWPTQHQAFDGGKMDAWIPAKGIQTMGYYTRQDIPFQYALAEAYTLCDAYHCSILSATGPNRTYLFSGWIDPNGTAGGPAYNGGEESGLSWKTYAEQLLAAGVTWKVYQSYDNYTDNGLEYFDQFGPYDNNEYGPYSLMDPSNPLYPGVVEVAGSGTGADPGTGSIDDLITAGIKQDLADGTFPQVCWIVPNQAFSEHPAAPPSDGAHFVHQVLDALAEHPDVLDSTVVFIDYDENDGEFDHVPPPVPEAGTVDEFIPGDEAGVSGLPIGLGFRVPLFVVSPWTRGGYITSELSDHTSVLQFLERWTAAIGQPAPCPYISDWRREVCSDLVDLFDFEHPVYGLPELPATSKVIGLDYCNTLPGPSPDNDVMPSQEPGTKPARPLPYQPNANLTGFTTGSGGAIQANISLTNLGPQATSATHFYVYANGGNPNGPWPYTVGAAGSSTSWRLVGVEVGAGLGDGVYNLTVIGPNRFLRGFTGNATTAGSALEATVSYDEGRDAADWHDAGGKQVGLALELANRSSQGAVFTVVADSYRTGKRAYEVAAGRSLPLDVTEAMVADGWYDFTVTVDADASWSRRFVGHLENGQVSITG